MMPKCGCKNGCEHQLNPSFPPQRTCRLGYVPKPLMTRNDMLIGIAVEVIQLDYKAWSEGGIEGLDDWEVVSRVHEIIEHWVHDYIVEHGR